MCYLFHVIWSGIFIPLSSVWEFTHIKGRDYFFWMWVSKANVISYRPKNGGRKEIIRVYLTDSFKINQLKKKTNCFIFLPGMLKISHWSDLTYCFRTTNQEAVKTSLLDKPPVWGLWQRCCCPASPVALSSYVIPALLLVSGNLSQDWSFFTFD